MTNDLKHISRALSLSVLSLAAACGDGDTTARSASPSTERNEPAIEEPDLYRIEGSTLYVQNPSTGLNILDVTDAARPSLLGRTDVMGGAAQLYVRPSKLVIVMLSVATDACRSLPGLETSEGPRSELVLVDAGDAHSPQLLGRYCLPGSIVASRTVDEVLYAVTATIDAAGGGVASGTSSHSRAFSIDLANPRAPKVVRHENLLGSSTEILLTEDTLVVASQDTQSASARTRIAFFAIDAHGKLDPRGETSVPGAPQGRFHMDLREEQFRIVTFDGASSRLTILDASDPTHLEIIGSLTDIGSSEKLYATRFDGDLAYVVTFRRTDPLWILSLKDPTHPFIAGELVVPGYSDFLFPRGDRLAAVGRAADVRSLGLSLFDVSDPTSPQVLDQVQLGVDSISEANLDHRGVSILEQVPGGGPPALVVPYGDTTRTYEDGQTSCRVRNHLQIVDLEPNSLVPRGRVDLRGAVRRSFLVGDALYGLSDYEVKALTVSNRNEPSELAQLTLGTEAGLRASSEKTCATGFGGDDFGGNGEDVGHYGCSFGGGATEGGSSLGLLGALLLVLRLVSRARARRIAAVLTLATCLCLGGRARADEASCAECVDQPDLGPRPAPAQPASPSPAAYPPRSFIDRVNLEAAARHTPELGQRRIGLGVAGINIFFAAYGITAGAGHLTDEPTLAIPVLGPFVYMGQYRERFDCPRSDPETVVSCRSESSGDRMMYGGLVMSALIQAGGIAMIGAGFGTRSKMPSFAVAPNISAQQAGLTVAGRF